MEEGRPIRETVQRVAFELQEAGASKWQVMRVLKELEGFSGSEQQLRRRAHEEMAKLNPEAARTFISFERMQVYTSREKRERFDRGNIIKSLLRETKVSRAVAERIGSEVEDRIKDLKIEYLNTPLIREMVGVKLLEYGHEPVHKEYARVGIPAFEVRKRLEAGNAPGPEIMREYAWLSHITGRAREMHFDSLIHIFYPEDFATRILCGHLFLPGEPEDMALAAKAADGTCSLPATAVGMNFSFAAAGGSVKKIMDKIARAGKVFSLTKGPRKAEMALFADFEWQEKQQAKKKAVAAAKEVLSTASEMQTLQFYASVDSKYQLKLLGKNFSGRLEIANNSRERSVAYQEFLASGKNAGHGILNAVGINLEKLAQAGGEKAAFLSSLTEATETITSLSARKKELLAKRKERLAGWNAEELPTAVCLSGLLSASRAFAPENPGRIAEEIIMQVQKEGFLAMEMPSESSAAAFGAVDERQPVQEMLLRIGQRARKNYGFMYRAANMKEAEALLADAPFAEVLARGEPAEKLQERQ